MDALRLLAEDHLSFGLLFKRYRAAQTARLREDLARRLLHEAQLHIALEEKYVYPIARERSDAAIDDHRETKRLLADLQQRPFNDGHFAEQLGAFVDEILEHSRQEELHFFPPLRKSMRRAELEVLGRIIQNAREARPPEVTPESLVARAVDHVLTAWKSQLTQRVDQLCSVVLRSAPSPWTQLL